MAPAPCLDPPPPGLLAGIEDFNRGDFFECHDKLEALWMAEPCPVRRLYQGILQIGVAFYHLRRGRYLPVVTLLERGSGYLQPYAPRCMGLEVTQLLAGVDRCLAEVRRLGPERVGEFDWAMVPKVEIGEWG